MSVHGLLLKIWTEEERSCNNWFKKKKQTTLIFRQFEVTHQLTPSASTQANLYSLTLNISCRQPATHWTYWELCRGQAQTFTHCEAFFTVEPENNANVKVPGTVSAVLKHKVDYKQIRDVEEGQSSTCTTVNHQIRGIAHARRPFRQRMPDQTPDRTRQSSSRVPSHLSRVMEIWD